MKETNNKVKSPSEQNSNLSIATQNNLKGARTMKKQHHSLRRVFASALAVTTAAAIVIAGTYGWSAISQIAKGTADGTTQNGGGENQTGPGGRLHFDFDRDSGAAEVYAENFGTEPLFVRARLNVTTDLTDSEVTYTYGGDKIFMPTFLKDSTKLYSDVTGDAIDPLRETAPVPEYPDYTENETKTETAYYTDQTNALATHKAKSTLTGAAPIAIADWDGDPADRWFIDADGWYYWGAPLEAGEATSLLLNAIEFKADRDDWEFVILPEAEFVDIDDIGSFTGTSDEADELLAVFAPEPEPAPIVRGDSRILRAIGTTGDETTNFWPANGENSIILRRQVLTISVVNYIPANLETNPIYLHSWDVSEARDYSVMAWYILAVGETNEQGEPMYDLFLGAEGTVKTGTNVSRLFGRFTNATTIDVPCLDTSNATDMRSMFASTAALVSLDLSSFDTSNVTRMDDMFYGTGLISLDLSGWKTSKVTHMFQMFINANKLTYLDLSSFDIPKLVTTQNMFSNTSSLKTLDMSNADFSNVMNSTNMFNNSGLRTTPGTMIVKDQTAKTFIEGIASGGRPYTVEIATP